MKINEVEAQVGITKKNIRFYEEQGLLSPRRNSENGYRDYGEEEVKILRQIKLMRKLGVPLEEIRQMQSGAHTVGDGLRRHLVTLERERHNLEQAERLCETLKDQEVRLDSLDAQSLLEQMETLEQEGTTFQDKQMGDARRLSYVAPVVVTVLVTIVLGALIGVILWAGFTQPKEAPPLFLALLMAAVPALIILGTYLALYQRVKEIQKGEMDDAKKY